MKGEGAGLTNSCPAASDRGDSIGSKHTLRSLPAELREAETQTLFFRSAPQGVPAEVRGRERQGAQRCVAAEEAAINAGEGAGEEEIRQGRGCRIREDSSEESQEGAGQGWVL